MMSLLQFRKWHKWVSIAITVPFLITLLSGIMLATRGFNSWVQPQYQNIKSNLNVSFPKILEAARGVPEAQIYSWEDISQIDIRPSTGNIRVRSKNNLWEIQVDGASGRVTGKGIRRFPLLIALHEGAYFGSAVRYGIFLPSSLGVFFLLISGVVLYFQPQIRNRKKGKLK